MTLRSRLLQKQPSTELQRKARKATRRRLLWTQEEFEECVRIAQDRWILLGWGNEHDDLPATEKLQVPYS